MCRFRACENERKKASNSPTWKFIFALTFVFLFFKQETIMNHEGMIEMLNCKLKFDIKVVKREEIQVSTRSVILAVLLLATILISSSWRFAEADEVPAFFLKIAKNIPRVGRSGRFEDYFLKAAKNIPRIGRRDGYKSPGESVSMQHENEVSNGPAKRMMNLPSLGIEDPSWSHFPLAIEGPPELWRTLAAYTNDRTGYGADDIDNEIWQRDKRAGNDAAASSS